ncbi:MAG: VOC family protein [Calditrichaeota bacterium]|nr:VOC family protein [Calditrichota bacterium]RQW02738.1 MAG: VOC family protein [Calditrichota bacterium]
MNPVGWFEIPASDLKRAKKFYESILGYELQLTDLQGSPMVWFPFEEGIMGTSGALISSEEIFPSHDGTTVYFTVSDLEETLNKVTENGGKILISRTSIGEHGTYAHIEDSEGNRIGLHSRG